VFRGFETRLKFIKFEHWGYVYETDNTLIFLNNSSIKEVLFEDYNLTFICVVECVQLYTGLTIKDKAAKRTRNS